MRAMTVAGTEFKKIVKAGDSGLFRVTTGWVLEDDTRESKVTLRGSFEGGKATIGDGWVDEYAEDSKWKEGKFGAVGVVTYGSDLVGDTHIDFDTQAWCGEEFLVKVHSAGLINRSLKWK